MTNYYSNELNAIRESDTATGLETNYSRIYHSHALVDLTQVSIEADSEGDHIFFAIDLPSVAKIILISIESQTFKLDGDMDLGIWAAVDFQDGEDFYLENSMKVMPKGLQIGKNILNTTNSMSTGIINLRFESEARLWNYNRQLWQLGGLYKDPKIPLRLALSTSYTITEFVSGKFLCTVWFTF